MRRSFSFLLTLIMTFSLSLGVMADELGDTKSDLNETKKSIEQNKEKIKDIEEDQKYTESQIKDLDVRMNKLSDEIDKLKNDITITSEELMRLTEEIDLKIAEIESQQELLNKRICAMYKSGNLEYVSIILGSKDFSDFVQRTIYVEKFVTMDKNLIQSFEENKKLLEEKKTMMEEKKEELRSIETRNVEKLSQLDEKSDEKKEFMNGLEKDKKEYEKLVDQEEAEAKALKEKIKKLEAIKISNGKLFCVTGKPYRITSNYGNRLHPVLGIYRFHAGIDIGVYSGTPLYSLKDGVVAYTGTMSGYGKVVMVHHGDIISLYAHLSSIKVSEGAKVKGGQLIANSGNTGLSSGPHLHFEIRKTNGETINPIKYYIK